MTPLKSLFNVLHEDVDLCSAEEIKTVCKLIIAAQEMDSAEAETLIACFARGPLHDGDVPSKRGRDSLLSKGFLAQIVVNGEDGHNACTHKGAAAFKIIKAGL